MSKVDFTSIQLGQYVSRSTIKKGSVSRRTKHKVINFSDKFFVIDTHEKITYDGKRFPLARGIGEAPVIYSFWKEEDCLFYEEDVSVAAAILLPSILKTLHESFPDCSDSFIRAKIIELLRE